MKLVTINGHRRLVDDNYIVPEPEKAVEKDEEPVKVPEPKKAEEPETKAKSKPSNKGKTATANKSRRAGSTK